MDISTHFVFDHKIFTVEGSYFSADPNDGEPYLSMPFGDSTAHLGFDAIRAEFSISDNSTDGNLLEIVQRALKYVKVTVALIREVRDEIHCSLRIWDDLVSSWQAEGHSKNEEVLSSLLQESHRFLAENYPIKHTW